MNLSFKATPVTTSSLAVNILLKTLGSGLTIIKRFGAPFTENHYILNDLVVNQEPSKLGQFIVLTPEDAEILQQPLEEGNSRLLLLVAESGNLVMAFDLPEEEIQQKLVPMLNDGFPLMKSITPLSRPMSNMAPPIQPWNNPAGLNPMPFQGAMDMQFNTQSNALVMNQLRALMSRPSIFSYALSILSNRPNYPRITEKGEIYFNGKQIGKCEIKGNIFINLSQMLKVTFDNSTNVVFDPTVFLNIVEQLVALYTTVIKAAANTFDISIRFPVPTVESVLDMDGCSLIMDCSGSTISYRLFELELPK